ncbi:MAG TPA: metallophosphoesterase, partial [Prosthecobacter sp.]
RVPDLCLMLGDNAYNSGTDTEYQTGYFSMYDNIFRKMPQWSTLGNHDANNGTTNPSTNFPYFDMFTFPTAGECGGVASGTEHYYSFDYGNIHFICLDSQTTLASSSASAPQTVWLKNDLASTTATWIVAFFHHPIYSKGSHNSDSEGQMVTMRQVYAPILEAGGCDLIFVGHSHNYERSYLMSGHYGTSGTITSSMRKQSGNGSVTGFTTSASGVIRSAPTFSAVSTTAGTVIAGDGPYTKPLTGPRDGFGTVYNTAGMSGLADAGSINHTAMYLSYNLVGTVNLDADGNTLTCTFVQSGGATPDNFTIVKQGYADSDGDGMSDEWEMSNGLDRYNPGDANQQPPGGGRTPMERFLLGLNDTDRTTYNWQNSPPDPVTGAVTVSFPTLRDRKYQVFWSTDLIIWNPASAEILGDGTTRTWTDDGAVTGDSPGNTADKKRFYRVTLKPAQ